MMIMVGSKLLIVDVLTKCLQVLDDIGVLKEGIGYLEV